jgi:hypothetical protein
MAKLSTESLMTEFKNVLDDEHNRRTIVSGIFGIGKTTFFKDFFAKNMGEYVCIHIFPVNYSVAKTEDIFELIKYDLLYILLQLNPSFEKIDVKWYEALPFIRNKDVVKIIGEFVSLIPKVGKDIKPIIEALKQTYQTFKKNEERLAKDDLEDIFDFAQKIENTPGGIYENDFYTKLIESLIDSLKIGTDRPEDNKLKKVVLVIDDLDRIDPDHIFRILNVFAAHFDIDGSKNKFNIDKIVLCCDIQNVRRIFHQRYGANVDFSGYIDKFFSKGVFAFRNNENIAASIPTILSTISSPAKNIFIFDENSYGNVFLVWLMNKFNQKNLLNLRVLLKYHNSEYVPTCKSIITLDQPITIFKIPVLLIFEFLIDSYGSPESCLNVIEQIEFTLGISSREDKCIVGDLMMIAHWNGRLLEAYSNHDERTTVLDGQTYTYTVLSEKNPTTRQSYYHGIYSPKPGETIVSTNHLTKLLTLAFKTHLILRK